MGKVQSIQSHDKTADQFAQFLEKRKKLSGSSIRQHKTTFNAEIKWKRKLLQNLEQMSKKSKWKQICKQMVDIIKPIPKQNFIKAISILSSLDSRQLSQLNSKAVIKQNHNSNKIVRMSKNVFLNMDKKFKQIRKSFVQSTQPDNIDDPIVVQQLKKPEQKDRNQQQNRQQNRQKIKKIMILQFNQPTHPFKKIKQSFVTLIQMKYRQIMNHSIFTQQLKQKLYGQIRNDITFFCEFLSKCSSIYKKWIMQNANIDENKYMKFLKKNLLNYLFEQSNLYKVIFNVVKQVNHDYFMSIKQKIKDNISIDKFEVKEQLQIQGCYINSLILFSNIDKIYHPKLVLKHLQDIKNQICNDIDQFYKMCQSQNNYTIDGDNLLGILCYQICKLKQKYSQIYSQIVVLNIVYGQKVNLEYGSASYMVTAIMATFQYLQSQEFLNNMK